MNNTQNIGVYKLQFKSGFYYVGQSVSLHVRHKKHFSALKSNTHFNYKMQEEYNKLKNLPEYSILVHCDIVELNIEETKLISLSDPMCLNIMMGGNSTYGVDHPCSKYYTDEIEQAFLLLVDNPGIRHSDVANISGIAISTVHDISAGRGRVLTELNKVHPEKYTKLLNMKADNTRNKNTLILTHVDGREVVLVTGGYSEFCRENKIHLGNLTKVHKGERKSTGGWSLVTKYENKLKEQ